MPFNGSGVYTAPAADFPVVTQTVISSTHFNNTINDIATALSTCLTKDGQQTATANIPFGGFRATNVGITAIAGSVGTPAINVSDVGTGLYRSAASELAVTVAGTQRARFDGTGLIVTGATSTTTLTASTSVVTPLVQASGVSLVLEATGANQVQIKTGSVIAWGFRPSTENYDLYPTQTDNTQSIGAVGSRVKQLFTPIIDTGTTGSGVLKTNAGTTVLTWANSLLVTLAGNLTVSGGTVGTGATSDLLVTTSGGTQAQFVHTASSTRWVTIAGSNGGNPTLSTTAGSLAITPSVVIAGSLLQIGTTPSSTSPGIGLPSTAFITTRNAANSGDMVLIQGATLNSVNDIVIVGGTAGVGIVGRARSGAGVPTTSDIPSGTWSVWRDTSGATTKLYYNNAGALQSVALA